MVEVFWASIAVLLYVYAGYPVLLRLLVRVRGCRSVQRRDITPTATLVISAYNEAAVIRQKLANALALDYPRDRLRIVVVSDASTDDTDDIVAEFAPDGVELQRQPERRGKTAGLNRTMPTLSSDIVVFSDANAMYQPGALRMLVRNFADPAVGCVTGEARYSQGGHGVADAGERIYWDYEAQSKRLETCLGSMVGADGAIYAIRRTLWKNLPDTAINDFLNPLQIVADGWRAVYEPEAICDEETAGGIRKEFRRRIRIVSRSWRAVFQEPRVLNPFRYGFFSVAVMSHKVLRWLSGLFLLTAVAAGAGAGARMPAWSPEIAGGGALLFAALMVWSPARKLAGIALYFLSINAASLIGTFYGSIGRVTATWTPPRSRQDRFVPASHVLPPLALMLAAAGVAWLAVAHTRPLLNALFWGPVALIAYIYLGYPLLLVILKRVVPAPVRTAAAVPHVCVFIAANDEADVIGAKLRNTLAQDYPFDRLSIVVASDGSVDATNEIVRGFAPCIRLVELAPRRGKIGAINAGISQVPAEAEIIVFTDANAFLESGAIRALVRNLEDPSVGAVSGDVALIGDRAALGGAEDLYYRYERWLQHGESLIGSMVGVDGALYAIRRHLFVPPPADTILDDVSIPMAVVRQGFRVVFEPAARATEQGSLTAVEEFVRKVRIIAGAVQFLSRGRRQIPWRSTQVLFSLWSHKALRWLSPIFVVLALGAAIALAGDAAVYRWAAAGMVLFLAGGMLGCSAVLRRMPFIGMAHYVCLAHAAAVAGLMRGLAARQPVAWRRFARAPVADASGSPDVAVTGPMRSAPAAVSQVTGGLER